MVLTIRRKFVYQVHCIPRSCVSREHVRNPDATQSVRGEAGKEIHSLPGNLDDLKLTGSNNVSGTLLLTDELPRS